MHTHIFFFPSAQTISLCLCSHAASRVEACCCPGRMVGLRNCSTWEPLLLKASCIKSCANGCSLGITAHLTYANADIESVEGEGWDDRILEQVIIPATVFRTELYFDFEQIRKKEEIYKSGLSWKKNN